MAIPIKKSMKMGKSGFADVSVRRDDIEVRFDDGQRYTIPLENAPEWIKSAQQFVTLSEDNLKIFSVRLPKGTYFAKFTEFLHKKDEPPIYRTVPYKPKTAYTQWDTPAHLEFSAKFEVYNSKGAKYDGYEAIYNMWYVFADYDGTGSTTCMMGRGIKKVEGFLNAVGLDLMKDNIPFSDNVLPALQDMVREKGKGVVLTVGDNGWVTDVLDAPGE